MTEMKKEERYYQLHMNIGDRRNVCGKYLRRTLKLDVAMKVQEQEPEHSSMTHVLQRQGLRVSDETVYCREHCSSNVKI